MYVRIVVPLDGSELAEKALPHAEGLSRLTEAPLHLVRVVDAMRIERRPNFGFGLEAATVEESLVTEEAAALAYLGKMERSLMARGCSVTEEVRRGSVPLEICASAEAGDVIVMASHGRGGLTRWFVGSVAEEVVRHSKVPVLLVRAGMVDTAGAVQAGVAAIPNAE